MNNGLVIEPPSYKVKDTDITGFPPEVAENPVEGNVKLQFKRIIFLNVAIGVSYNTSFKKNTYI